jgi:hypothetical protein
LQRDCRQVGVFGVCFDTDVTKAQTWLFGYWCVLFS